MLRSVPRKAILVFVSILAVAATASNQLPLEVIPTAEWKTAPDVISFQPYLETIADQDITLGAGAKAHVRLLNLNKNVGIWYVLEVNAKSMNIIANLENPNPKTAVSMDASGVLKIGDKTCDLLGTNITDGALARSSKKDPYVSLCNNMIFLRTMQSGYKDSIAWGTTFLRDNFGDAGDALVNDVKETFFDGKYFVSGSESDAAGTTMGSQEGPSAARVSASVAIRDHGIDFDFAVPTEKGLQVGQWYAAKNFRGVYLSSMKAKFVAADILQSYRDRVNALDASSSGESEALVASMAFDLDIYGIGWNDGTEHPGVGWSSRARNVSNVPAAGPDGFSGLSPLTFPGVMDPAMLARTVGTFTGGFQRHHSAFKSGPLSTINKASHYGFMEKGVVMSTIVPNLATIVMNTDGTTELKTWKIEDGQQDLSRARDIRQNGVPLIEDGIPGPMVGSWVNGNWSGSAEVQLKTPRTSACMLERGQKRYLMVSYFSTHTPNAMARVLQAYGCKYAVHLDMNSPVFSYSAFFTALPNGKWKIEHLHDSMREGDVKANGATAPKSILTPTYKDFFYIYLR